ncbi:hypothetical protein SAMN05877753_103212 [Bacillus oleivorans]|uniref:Uncharacterized protein n=1 Tax=Bacillus oleivorans TaxID=1448271 RepID=A0A285CS15_9BACI|nr:hypothetical protein SAMN05877753_103212 [Bacillus oleivorans]
MRLINDLRNLCKRYEKEEFDLVELQGRLRTVVTPEPDFHSIDKLLLQMDNELEEIIFTQIESNHQYYARQAIKNFLNKLNEIERSAQPN